MVSSGSRAGAGPALIAEGLERGFGAVRAIDGVSLRVEAGEGLLVAGPNGSGKTTLLRLLAGALRAERGSVAIAGSSRREDILRRTALLGSTPNAYERLSAFENLELAAKILGRPAERRSLERRLEEVGLGAWGDAPVRTLSSGMRRRLGLARLLLQRPEVALLDEPHSGLDPDGAALLDRIVTNLQGEGVAVLVASHRLERATRLCGRAILLAHGRIQWSGESIAMPDFGDVAGGAA